MWEVYILAVAVNILFAVANMVSCIWEHDTKTLLPWTLAGIAWLCNFFWGLRRMGEK
jgi:hypothetical protein